jgi:hypothetical protein
VTYNHHIGCGEKPGPLDQRPGKQRRSVEKEQILTIGSEHKGTIVIRYKVKCMSFNLCVHRRVDWPKSQSELGPFIAKRDKWCKIHNS